MCIRDSYRDRTREATPRPAPATPPPPAEIPALLGLDGDDHAARPRPERPLDLRMRVAGFGGQGVLTLGYVLAEAGMEAGYEVSWLPSYGPEMRSGTSNCHVRLSNEPISSPLVSRPNVDVYKRQAVSCAESKISPLADCNPSKDVPYQLAIPCSGAGADGRS